MASHPHRVGSFGIGYSRIGVLEPIFENWKLAGATVQVSRRKRVVSTTSDLYTAHPNLSWSTSTIDAVVRFGQAGREDLAGGVAGSVEGVIYTADALFHLDRFDYLGERYEIVNPPLEVRGRDGGFLYRKASFRRVELEEV